MSQEQEKDLTKLVFNLPKKDVEYGGVMFEVMRLPDENVGVVMCQDPRLEHIVINFVEDWDGNMEHKWQDDIALQLTIKEDLKLNPRLIGEELYDLVEKVK